jgi:hypothetical protein
MSVCTSVRPRETTRLQLDGFLWKLMFECFSKIYRENWTFIKIWQEERTFHLKTNIHLWYFLTVFSEWDPFLTKVVEEIKTHILRSITISPESCAVYGDNLEQYCRARRYRWRHNDCTLHVYVVCWRNGGTLLATHTQSTQLVERPVLIGLTLTRMQQPNVFVGSQFSVY